MARSSTMGDEVLGFRLEVDSKNAIKAVKKWNVENLKAIKSARTYTKALEKDTKSYFGAYRAAAEAHTDEVKALKSTMGQFKTETMKAEKQLERTLSKLEELKKTGADMASAEARSLTQTVKMNKEKLQLLEDASATAEATHSKTVEIAFRAKVDALKNVGADLAKPFMAVLNKDAAGAFEEGGRLLGTGIEHGFKQPGRLLTWAAKKFEKAGQSVKEGSIAHMKGSKGAGGKVAGAAGAAAGAAAQGIGKVLGGIGNMVQMFAKLGPLISMTAGALVGIVKLLIDADSAAKEFNSELLQTASTGEFLSDAAATADTAFMELNETVTALRDSANNLEQNMAWGTTKKDHMTMNNILTQEGVSIHRMKKEFEAARDAGKFAGDEAAYYTKNVAVAVKYARNFGVALTDVATLQSEMMRDMGMTAEQSNNELALMANQAKTSGMAMNTFYGIMRNISADLALYNVRIGEAGVLLGKLGKHMSSKTAGKFMQTLAGGMKNMGVDERLKMTLLADHKKAGTTAKILKADIEYKAQDIAENLADAAGKGADKDLITKIATELKSGNREGANQLIKGITDKEKQGTLRESVFELSMQAKGAKKGGKYSRAKATGNLGMGGSLELMEAASTSLMKAGKSLKDVAEGDEDATIAFEKTLQLMGKSESDGKQMMQAIEAMEDSRKEMLGDSSKSEAEKVKIANAGYTELLGMMTKEQRKAVEEAQKAPEKKDPMEELAKKQGQMTMDIGKRLEIIMDFIMNQIYKALSGMWDVLVAQFGDDKAKRAAELRKMVTKSKDPELMKLWNDMGDDVEKFEKALDDKSGGNVQAGAGQLGALEKQYKELVTALAAETDESKKQDLANKAALARARLGNASAKFTAADNAVSADMVEKNISKGKLGVQGTEFASRLKDLLPSGTDDTKKDAVLKAMRSGGLTGSGATFGEALKEAGFTPEEMSSIMASAFSKLSTAGRASAIAQAQGSGVATTVSGTDAQVHKEASDTVFTDANGNAVAANFATPSPAAAGGASRPGTTTVPGASRPGTTTVTPLTPEQQAADLAAEKQAVLTGQPLTGQPQKPMTMQDMPTASGTHTTPTTPMPASTNDPVPKVIATNTEDAAKNTSLTAEWLDKIYAALRKKGIKIDASGPHTPFAPSSRSIEDQVLEAARKALFEFHLYKDVKPEELMDAMKGGKFDYAHFGAGLVKGGEKEGSKFDPKTLYANSNGGIVTGVKNGLAQVVSPAPGEGLASVGPGERIQSVRGGGGGGSTININLTGMVDPELEKKITATIIEHERRKARG